MLIAAILALFVGVSLGLLGGGGSILTLPVLVYVVGLAPRDGVASSLLIVGVTSGTAMLGHARAGRVRWSIGVFFGAASMLGAFAGGRLSHLVPAAVLLGGFTFLMLITALAMMRRRPERDDSAVAPVALGGGALARALAVGVAIGLLTGVVGAGGGFVIVPALTLLCALPMRAAVGTSLLVITMNSFAGFAGAAAHATIPWTVVGVMTTSAVLGSFAGAALTTRVSPASLRKGFAWFILAMTAFMVWKQLPGPLVAMMAELRTPLALGCTLFAGALVALVLFLRRRRRSLSEAP